MDSKQRLSILDVTSLTSVGSGLPDEVQHPPPTYQEPVFESLATYHISRNNAPPPSNQIIPTTMDNACKIYSRVSQSVTCPRCHTDVMSVPQPEVGTGTWMTCIAILLLGGILGCCIIPFYLNITKNHRHRCPICKQTIDIYKPCCA